MNNNDIILKNYYDIDLNNQIVSFISSEENEVLTGYITNTVNYVIDESKNCQQYKLKRDTNEVFTIIKSSIETMKTDNLDVFNRNCELIANMLLESEIKISKGAIKPVNGGLIQAIIKNDTGYYYVLIKNEFFSAVDRISMEMIEAFLYDKKKKPPLKICIFDISELNSILDVNTIFIDDSIQKKHSVYWYDDFLGLKKCNSNEVNTNNAVERITLFWENNIKDHHEALTLRNDTISYFRSNDYFDFNDFMDNIKSRHEFDDENDIFEKLDKISKNERNGFDNRFEISQEDIKKRIVTKKFHPAKTITLSIEGIIDFNEICVTEENGMHIVKIRTEDEKTIKSLTKASLATSEN
ncbi:nucleoid-associated protein [Sporanaerobacter acetigenes]|uniref:nucleoid-associated protein n=1 Tax=Sporanaerobacter acetigenes TaxID=165813 RepID=UPI003318417D